MVGRKPEPNNFLWGLVWCTVNTHVVIWDDQIWDLTKCCLITVCFIACSFSSASLHILVFLWRRRWAHLYYWLLGFEVHIGLKFCFWLPCVFQEHRGGPALSGPARIHRWYERYDGPHHQRPSVSFRMNTAHLSRSFVSKHTFLRGILCVHN